jgi:hypothetical protein
VNYLIDNEHAVIVDVEPTPARTFDEVQATAVMIERTEQRFGLKPKLSRLTPPTARASSLAGWLAKEKIAASYTDLIKAFGANEQAGASHFITNGFDEGRSAAPFNVVAYESAHPDLSGKYASDDAFLTAYINTYATSGKFLT